MTLTLNQHTKFIGLCIDSEDPLKDLDATWAHLKERDKWEKPDGTTDEQVLFMTTCMETWIAADRNALSEHFGQHLQGAALPPLNNLESRPRHDVQEKLFHATRRCRNFYTKGKRSFEILGKLNPEELKKRLPSFVRICRILSERL